jgi:CDGSH-type Zn-finger protein
MELAMNPRRYVEFIEVRRLLKTRVIVELCVRSSSSAKLCHRLGSSIARPFCYLHSALVSLMLLPKQIG